MNKWNSIFKKTYMFLADGTFLPQKSILIKNQNTKYLNRIKAIKLFIYETVFPNNLMLRTF